MANISDLLGKTLTACEKIGDDVIKFTCNDGKIYNMFHDQDCCEIVSIEDINGDLQDLVGSPITLAKKSTSSELTPEQLADKAKKKEEAEAKGEDYYDWDDESFTWTFYKLATIKGYVDIRWYGSSNGYYSESVDFVEESKSGWND